MRYQRFLDLIVRETGIEEKQVRALFEALPEILFEIRDGDALRTPIGTFRGKLKPPREVRLPTGDTVMSQGEYRVVLRPGAYLTKPLQKDS